METQDLSWVILALAQSKEGAMIVLLVVIIFAMTFRNEVRQAAQKVSDYIRARLFGGALADNSTARICPTNPTHVLDPNWQGCPYCEADRKSQAYSLGGEPPTPKDGKGTIVGTTDTRQITGALITYSWRPEGQLFPIRAGKNFVGRGEISSESAHRNCDVLVSQDEQMSGEHALILCQQGNYQIIDQMSSNGTFLNGQLLMANQTTALDNYATVQTGKTTWTFIKMSAPQATEVVAPVLQPKENRVRNEDAGRET